MRDVPSLTLVVSGALAMGYALAALFFTKFWRRTRVALFGWFALAFGMLALQRTMLVVFEHAPDEFPWSHVIRLLAFVMILTGIALQNRAPRAGGRA
jgi:membrane-associated PAP2 superfamily phosphatase